MMPVLERVRANVRKDMQGVSKVDATLALVGIVAGIPGFLWVTVTHWDSFMAYLASL